LKQEKTLEFIRALPRDREKIRLFETLHSRNYKIACVSNCVRNTLEYGLHALGLRDYVDKVVSNESVTFRKPNSAPYLYAMFTFGAAPKECLILEDSDKGIRSALDSGGNLVYISHPDVLTLEFIERWIKLYEQN
jgi:beta-phosphoglucomutase